MKIGVLGTGMVGQTIATKLVSLGHDVKMGARDAKNEKAAAWVAKSGAKASHGTFADAAASAEILFVCTNGNGTLAALRSAGSLGGKILIDLSNSLDFSKGMPPTLTTGNTDSLGEQIQREFPDAKVVKTLNTINCSVMVDAGRVAGGDHTVFMSGNDASAKARVAEILKAWFGWKDVLDLGDITTARGPESYLHLWLRTYQALGTADFNIKVVR
ncbi:MAG TPA: NAD(P)-binding domain-containing protein [Polyangiaceae bacterium]